MGQREPSTSTEHSVRHVDDRQLTPKDQHVTLGQNDTKQDTRRQPRSVQDQRRSRGAGPGLQPSSAERPGSAEPPPGWQPPPRGASWPLVAGSVDPTFGRTPWFGRTSSPRPNQGGIFP